MKKPMNPTADAAHTARIAERAERTAKFAAIMTAVAAGKTLIEAARAAGLPLATQRAK